MLRSRSGRSTAGCGDQPRLIDRIVAPALATTVIGIIFIAPIVLFGVALARESHFVVEFIANARYHGIPVPLIYRA